MPLLLGVVVALEAAGDDDGSKKGKNKVAPPAAPVASIRKSAATSAPDFDIEQEADALAFVQEHHPELATVLVALKPKNPSEYRKAIGELSQVSRTLADLKSRNPKRYELALDTWKAKSRVELLAAQLAGAPSEELRSQLRLAIEAKLDLEIRRQRFELEQAELAAKKAREGLDRLEKNRDSLVEARFRALQPKKASKPKKPASAPPVSSKAVNPQTTKDPNGEDRR
jgi:hypothetical protein